MYPIFKSIIIGGAVGVGVAFGVSFILGCLVFRSNFEACNYSGYLGLFLGLPLLFIGGMVGFFIGLSKWKQKKETTAAESPNKSWAMNVWYGVAFFGAALITFFFYLLNQEEDDQSLPWLFMGILSFGLLTFLVWFLGKRKR